MSEGEEQTRREDEESTRRHNVKLTRDPKFLSRPLRPLREVFGLCPATTEPLIYNVVKNHSRPAMKRKKKKASSVVLPEPSQDMRAAVAECRVADNLGREATSSSIFTSSFEGDLPPTAPVAAVPTISSSGSVCSLSQGVASAASPQHIASPVQSIDISSCSDMESVVSTSQPRRKARKRRRITSKLSLSQNSTRNHHHHHHQQSSQLSQSSQSSYTDDNVQFVKQVVHCQAYTNSSSSSDSRQTTHCSTDGLDPSRCFAKRDTMAESDCVPTSYNTLRQRPAHTSAITRESGEVKALTSSACRHRNNTGGGNEALHAAQHPHSHRPLQGHTQPQESLVRREEEVCVISASQDLDQTVYFDARSNQSSDESQPGPSGVQQPMGDVVQAEDDNTLTSFSYSAETDYAPDSSTNSDSSTFTLKPKLSKAVLKQLQQARNTQMQIQHKARQEGDILTNQRHTRITSRKPANTRRPQRHQQARDDEVSSSTTDDLFEEKPRHCEGQGSQESHMRAPSRLSSGSTTPDDLLEEPRHCEGQRGQESHMRAASRLSSGSTTPDDLLEEPRHCEGQGGQESHVRAPSRLSSSSLELVEEEELIRQVQTLQELFTTATSRLSSSTVSSSSGGNSSDSSVLLSEAGKSCIQAISEVFQRYFGGTLMNSLKLMQEKDFNMLHCILELQTASQHHQPSVQHHRPSLRPSPQAQQLPAPHQQPYPSSPSLPHQPHQSSYTHHQLSPRSPTQPHQQPASHHQHSLRSPHQPYKSSVPHQRPSPNLPPP